MVHEYTVKRVVSGVVMLAPVHGQVPWGCLHYLFSTSVRGMTPGVVVMLVVSTLTSD